MKALIETVKALTEKVESLETKSQENPDDVSKIKENDDIDLDNIEIPEKDEGYELEDIKSAIETTLPGKLKEIVDAKFDKALGKV
jgi:hypothetical protein